MLKKEKEHLWMAVKAVYTSAVLALMVGVLLGHVVVFYNEMFYEPVFGVIASFIIVFICCVLIFITWAGLSISREEYGKYKKYKTNKFMKEVLFRKDE